MVLKGIKIKLYPTIKQQEFIQMNLDLNRFLYNQLLEMQQKRFENGGSFVNKIGMNYLIKLMKVEFPFLKQAESTSLLYTSADLDDAFCRFFRKQTKYPRFKSKKAPKNSYKSNCVGNNIRIIDHHAIQLPKLGIVKAYGLNRVHGKIKSVVIRKQATGHYEATLQVEQSVEPFSKTGNKIGIDLGLTDLAIHSDGFKLKNKRFERTLAKKRRVWERKLARRRERARLKIKEAQKANVELSMSSFKNVEKAKRMVAKIHRKIANQREDYLQKYTTSLVKEFDHIAIEDLKSANMIKDRRFSRSIADASWARIKSLLQYKCEWYGKTLSIVSAAYTSQTCSVCKKQTGKKPVEIRKFTCPHCGTEHDRDINAAVNILNKSLA